jgi:signal transduction histidine kinase
MSLHQAPLQRTLTTDMATRHATSTRVRGRRLLLMRLGWTLLTLYNLVVFFVSIPAYYAQLFVLCTDPRQECATGQLRPGNVQALHHLGVSLGSYAAYTLAISIVASSIFLIVGLVLFWRKSDDWMAVFASTVLIIFAGAGDARASEIALLGGAPILITLLGVLATLILGVGGYCGLGLFFSLFPTGRPIPGFAWTLVFLWLVQIIPWALPPDSPYQILNWPRLLFAGGQLVLWGTSMGVQIYRYTLVSDHVQRQQSKWLIFGFALALLIDIPYFGLQGLFPALAAASSPYLLLYATVRELFLVFIPLAIGIAILRYRLWDIDLIINRTLVYGALTLSVIGLYVLVVVGLGSLIQAQRNVLLSLLATGLIAVLFQPLRLRLQRGVNRLMYGERDDPYAVLARLGSRLEATLVPEKVLPVIVETVAQTLKLPYVAIALLPEQESFNGAGTTARTVGALAVAGAEMPDIVAFYGTPTPDPQRVPLIYRAETIGYLLLAARAGDTFGKADERLLTDLARQAGVAVYAVRLTTHLQQLSANLQQARERLVTTREEERRRLRRDLHDGLGPALASLTFKVDAARNLLRQNSERTDTLLAEVRQQAQEAIIDIRRLVYNLRPPALDELGLLSALREQAALYQHQGLEVEVDVPSSLPPLPAAVEVAVYRIAQEALTNVACHAEAQRCLLRLCIDSEALHLDISDDGKGIPAGHRTGVGLHAMYERASELGGSCTITRGSSGGTTIQVRLPLAKAWDVLPSPPQHLVQQEQESVLAPDMNLVRQEE